MPDRDECGELLEPATRIGDYVLGQVLGSGGFGTVYEATNPVIARRVAIKVLSRRYSVDPRAVSRFLIEARVVNQVHHKNIVDISAFGRLDDGRHYHVMEYLEGETLEQLLARRGRLSLVDALPLLSGIAAALDAAHQRGVAHRDLKPANIFIVSEDDRLTPKIIDFGIAKLSSEEDGVPKTKSGALIGTPRYMSPEQARGKSVDHRSDIYSFGLVAYEVLTGTPPFDGGDELEILLKHTSHRADPPSGRCSDVAPGIDAVILALLEKDPQNRPLRLTPVVRLLERASRGEPFGVGELTADHAPNATSPLRRPAIQTLHTKDTLPLERRATVPVPMASLQAEPRAPSVHTSVALIAALGVAAAVAWTLRPEPSDAPGPAAPAATGSSLSLARVPAKREVPPPHATTAAPAERPLIELYVEATPDGTDVLSAGGVILGKAPGKIEVERRTEPLELTFRRAGYRDEVRSIVPTSSRTLRVDMRRQTIARRRTPGPDDSENPFR